MNEIAEKELKIIVEQAVEPIRATMPRKRRMREELLAHLVSIFEEEAQRRGDQQAALEESKRRFGDPRELTGQLQQTVPRLEKCRSVLENMGYQPGKSVWHLVVKHFLVMLTIYAIGPLVSLPIALTLGHHWGIRTCDVDLGLVLQTTLVLALFNAILSLALMSLVNKIGSILAVRLRGRILLAVLCGLALPIAFVPAFSGAVVVFVLMVRQTIEGRRYQEDWAVTAAVLGDPA